MQDRYVGDIGDFGKYALLNALAGGELRLGVQWYLNANKEDNTDGEFTDYPHLRPCDPVLYDKLQAIVQGGRRSIGAVERAGILPANTVFFSQPISSRAAWNARAHEILSAADVVFMDPDNGLTRQPAREMGPAGSKYVSFEEIAPYLRRGKSLIIYQHQTRKKGGLEASIFRDLHSLAIIGMRDTVGFRVQAPFRARILHHPYSGTC